MRKHVAVVLAACCGLAALGAEPLIELRLGAGRTVASGALVEAGQESVSTLDLVLSDALAEVNVDTVELTLNGYSIVGFARKSKTPSGIRLVVERGSTRHSHLAMAGENHLRFSAEDVDGNRYRGEFVVRVSEDVRGVQLLSGPDPPPAALEASEPKASPPVIAFTTDSDVSRDQRTWRLFAEVQDESGIRSVVVELNWKEFERIQMRNGFPSRQRGEFRKARRLPGSVTGDSRRLVLDIPVPLRKRETQVGLRATNSHGLEASKIVTIRRPR